jgi:hypothetical protein
MSCSRPGTNSLPHAQLTLVGTIHEDVKPALEQFATPSVNAVGFTSCVDEVLRQSDVHVFPSNVREVPASTKPARRDWPKSLRSRQAMLCSTR